MTSGEALDSVAESESTPAKKRHKNVLRRRPRFRASIQSKLMVLLLLNRPGMSGDSSSWKGWGHVRWFIEEVPAGAA